MADTEPQHLYPELKPGDRIDRLFLERVFPAFEAKGYKYFRSKRCIKKTNDFFDFHIGWGGGKYNQGNLVVDFYVSGHVYSPKYRKWETKFYALEKNWGVVIDGYTALNFPGWNRELMRAGWYDLVKHDNARVMNEVLANVESVVEPFFLNYVSFDSAIAKLSEYPIANFEKIVDFYILQDRYDDARAFFEANKQWHETEAPGDRRASFELRREKLTAR